MKEARRESGFMNIWHVTHERRDENDELYLLAVSQHYNYMTQFFFVATLFRLFATPIAPSSLDILGPHAVPTLLTF
jgi:hypothetical protein